MAAVNRLERVNALMRREIGEACFRILGGEGLNLAALSITRVVTSSDLRNATVYVSVFGGEEEKGRYLRALADHRRDFQRLVNRTMTLKYTPVLHFRLDESVEKGDRVLNLLIRMEAEEADAPTPAPDAGASGESTDPQP
ncbi:MAG: 30S ribosome-binding factor RbfA [Kiritimatiellia bacterium]|jgi:ribosome-binding factor A